MRLISLLILVSVLGLSPVRAQHLGLDAPVPFHPDATLFDLVKQIVPDLAVAADGTVTGTPPLLRHISDEDWAEGNVQEDFTIGEMEAVPFSSNGEDMIALKVEIGEGMPNAALAVFDSKLRLVDVADVGYDMHNSWHSPNLLAVGLGDDVLLTESYHWNSSQGYNMVVLIGLQNRELRLIDDIFLFTLRVCGFDEEQSLELTSTNDGPGYWPITATVTATHTNTDEDCGESTPEPEPDSTRKITVTYNWSASIGGYVADSDAFEKLFAEAEAKF